MACGSAIAPQAIAPPSALAAGGAIAGGAGFAERSAGKGVATRAELREATNTRWLGRSHPLATQGRSSRYP